MTKGRFISSGAEVTTTHTDEAATALVRRLASDHVPVADAVAQTMQEAGPGPAYGARLLSYP